MLTDSQSFSVTRIFVDVAVSTEDAELSEATEGSGVSEEWKSLDGIPCIMGGIRALVASLGGTLRGRTSTDFPWKTLPKELAHLGYVLINYPEETLMPGELQPNLSQTKGIHGLNHHHCVNIVNSLKAGTLTICTVMSDAARTWLITSKDPIIIGDAPSACSMYSFGRCTFADGRIDQKGLPCLRLPPAPASHCMQVIVEITWLPPHPASRALHKPSTRDLIPPIASVQGGSSSSETIGTNDEDDYEDTDSRVSESGSHPAKRLRRS
ncbi:uncharacterized protein EDB91DRAFT_1257845 [Suillus paluster]|uniref:uncharacterized protein n=1 Tax=Suillus paluster TaxID=48578 RepID=UPI001B8771E4|nr:uncharacterized protein EDB91DRAFT_1257845 [Suillus paluster]KAG1719200.1 hypothetical protein EDB91DRAFT_1257845 [Suillus paluster]